MADMRELKAQERRSRIRAFIRQGLTQVEMSKRLSCDVTTISEDVAVIAQENGNSTRAYQKRVENDVDTLFEGLAKIQEVEEEIWKVYYGNRQIVRKVTKKDEVTGEERTEEEIETLELPIDAKTQLDALEKIKACTLDKMKLLKLLPTNQINIENLNVIIQQEIPNFIKQVYTIVMSYLTEEEKLTFITKMEELASSMDKITSMKTIEVKGESDDTRTTS